MVLASSINIKDGSNAMRLVKGVWKKSSHNWELNHRPLTSRASVLPLHHCDSLLPERQGSAGTPRHVSEKSTDVFLPGFVWPAILLVTVILWLKIVHVTSAIAKGRSDSRGKLHYSVSLVLQ